MPIEFRSLSEKNEDFYNQKFRRKSDSLRGHLRIIMSKRIAITLGFISYLRGKYHYVKLFQIFTLTTVYLNFAQFKNIDQQIFTKFVFKYVLGTNNNN